MKTGLIKINAISPSPPTLSQIIRKRQGPKIVHKNSKEREHKKIRNRRPVMPGGNGDLVLYTSVR